MTFCLRLKWLISGKKLACCPWQRHTMHLRISRGDKMTLQWGPLFPGTDITSHFMTAEAVKKKKTSKTKESGVNSRVQCLSQQVRDVPACSQSGPAWVPGPVRAPAALALQQDAVSPLKTCR